MTEWSVGYVDKKFVQVGDRTFDACRIECMQRNPSTSSWSKGSVEITFHSGLTIVISVDGLEDQNGKPQTTNSLIQEILDVLRNG